MPVLVKFESSGWHRLSLLRQFTHSTHMLILGFCVPQGELGPFAVRFVSFLHERMRFGDKPFA